MYQMSALLALMRLTAIASVVTSIYTDTGQVEFCDLNFINDADATNAMNEYISVNSSSMDESLQNNSIPSNLHGKRHRLKRQLANYPKQRTIETAIFVDHHLKQRFANRLNDLKRLVMAVMNEVQLIYNYKTMKIPIRIVIVRFEILESPEINPDTAGGDIDRYLDNFCSWQAVKLRSMTANARWDHALLLTGLDLYKDMNGKRNKKVLGLAWVNGMCKPTYSCTLNEGKSFEAAFVIAHEMAHSLGILHDGKGNNCDPEKYLMSEKTGPGKVNWSPCSNKYLENFLARGNGRCLDNEVSPSPELDFQVSSRLPGEQYSPDLQCQLALGTQYKAYFSPKEPFNDACRELWCLSGSWATPAHPALEGSPCGENGAKCYQGSCSLTRDSRGAIDRRRTRLRADNRRNIIRRPSSGQSNRLRISLGLGPIGTGVFGRRGAKSEDSMQGSSGETIASAAQSAPSNGRPFSQVAKDVWSTFVLNAKSLLQRLLLL